MIDLEHLSKVTVVISALGTSEEITARAEEVEVDIFLGTKSVFGDKHLSIHDIAMCVSAVADAANDPERVLRLSKQIFGERNQSVNANVFGRPIRSVADAAGVANCTCSYPYSEEMNHEPLCAMRSVRS